MEIIMISFFRFDFNETYKMYANSDAHSYTICGGL